jgi:hypothetical protein
MRCFQAADGNSERRSGFYGRMYMHVHRPEGRAPAGAGAGCTELYIAMLVPRPAGHAGWKCAGFGRRWLQFLNSVRKIAFYGGTYTHVHRPE